MDFVIAVLINLLLPLRFPPFSLTLISVYFLPLSCCVSMLHASCVRIDHENLRDSCVCFALCFS